MLDWPWRPCHLHALVLGLLELKVGSASPSPNWDLDLRGCRTILSFKIIFIKNIPNLGLSRSSANSWINTLGNSIYFTNTNPKKNKSFKSMPFWRKSTYDFGLLLFSIVLSFILSNLVFFLIRTFVALILATIFFVLWIFWLANIFYLKKKIKEGEKEDKKKGFLIFSNLCNGLIIFNTFFQFFVVD